MSGTGLTLKELAGSMDMDGICPITPLSPAQTEANSGNSNDIASIGNSIQKTLRDEDKCRKYIEGNILVDWARHKRWIAIVESTAKQFGLFIYHQTGELDFTIALDSSVQLQISEPAQNPFSQDVVVQIISQTRSIQFELICGQTTEEFMNLLKEVCKTIAQADRSWFQKYTPKVTITQPTSSSETSSVREPLKSNPDEDYIPIAFDADDDLSCFDPYARKQPESKRTINILPRMDTVDILSEFENIPEPTTEQEVKNVPLSIPDNTREQNGAQNNSGSKVSNLLRRSREVVSQRDSFRISSNLEKINQSQANVENGYTPGYDVVDSAEAHTSSNYPTTGSRRSEILRSRENFIKLHMAAREKEFTEKYPFSILAGTWNVNGQLASEKLKEWFKFKSDPADIIAVGFQELDLSAEALLLNDSSREESWIKAIEKSLPSQPEYQRIRTVRLVGMMLVVFVQTKHMAHIYEIDSETAGTGIMGMMGNKGGVSVRFQLHNSTVCFVNSHLAAHLNEFERRNQDFKEISAKLQYTRFQPPMNITHHDIVIWIGDLNYRFDDLDVDQVKALVEINNYEELFKFDQLNKQMKAGKVFHGYTEGAIAFKPTYKYDPGTDNWDTSEKGRAPAWCDRILWRGKTIQLVEYKSHPSLKLSDHKPVSATFKVGIKIVSKDKEKQIFEEIVFKLDRQENEALPQVKLGKSEFYFTDVMFMEDQTDFLPVANVGQVPVEFQFIPKLDDKDICQPWLKIQPSAGVIMPGELVEIELTVSVDKEVAPLLTSGWRLDDILVLHLVDGKDCFVPINGTYIPSVFGTPLNTLIRMYGHIQQTSKEALIKLGNLDETDGKCGDVEPLEIPKELWLLVDHLFRHGMKEENILIQSGLNSEIVSIRSYLDTGQKGALPGSLFSVGEALLLFLGALPEPVIPTRFHNKCLEASNNYVLCKQVISQLPDCHGNVFRYLTAFLRELLKYSIENKLDSKMIATVFGGIILRTSPTESKNQNKKSQAQIAQKKARFVYHFLVNDFRD